MIIVANTVFLQHSRVDNEKQEIDYTLRNCLNKGKHKKLLSLERIPGNV